MIVKEASPPGLDGGQFYSLYTYVRMIYSLCYLLCNGAIIVGLINYPLCVFDSMFQLKSAVLSYFSLFLLLDRCEY